MSSSPWRAFQISSKRDPSLDPRLSCHLVNAAKHVYILIYSLIYWMNEWMYVSAMLFNLLKCFEMHISLNPHIHLVVLLLPFDRQWNGQLERLENLFKIQAINFQNHLKPRSSNVKVPCSLSSSRPHLFSSPELPTPPAGFKIITCLN